VGAHDEVHHERLAVAAARQDDDALARHVVDDDQLAHVAGMPPRSPADRGQAVLGDEDGFDRPRLPRHRRWDPFVVLVDEFSSRGFSWHPQRGFPDAARRGAGAP
jgi:hypothetical protein